MRRIRAERTLTTAVHRGDLNTPVRRTTHRLTRTLEPIGRPLTGHTNTVAAVAAATLPGWCTVAVTGSHDGTARVWDLASGTPIGPAQPMPYPCGPSPSAPRRI